MNARSSMLRKIREIIQREEHSTNGNSALSVLLPYVEDGSLTSYELEDSIVEMFFSAYNGEDTNGRQ